PPAIPPSPFLPPDWRGPGHSGPAPSPSQRPDLYGPSPTFPALRSGPPAPVSFAGPGSATPAAARSSGRVFVVPDSSQRETRGRLPGSRLLPCCSFLFFLSLVSWD